jgi:hypothetical protein
LANRALQKDRYDVVSDAASTVMAKGQTNIYYASARQLFLQARFKQVENGMIYKITDLRSLSIHITMPLKQQELKVKQFRFILILANLYAFYTHDTDSALEVF